MVDEQTRLPEAILVSAGGLNAQPDENWLVHVCNWARTPRDEPAADALRYALPSQD